jgi:hypothetical protein
VNPNQGPEQAVEWNVVETITVGKLMSKISKRMAGRPVFNFEIGAATEKGFGKRIRVYAGGQGKITIDMDKTGDLQKDGAELFQKSLDYILNKLQSNEDGFIDRRLSREHKGEYRPRKKEYKGHRQKGDKNFRKGQTDGPY